MQRVAVVRVDHVAPGASGAAVVPRLIVGAEEPHVRVVEPGLVNVQHGNGNASRRPIATVRDMQVGTARLVERLNSRR